MAIALRFSGDSGAWKPPDITVESRSRELAQSIKSLLSHDPDVMDLQIGYEPPYLSWWGTGKPGRWIIRCWITDRIK